MWLSPLRVMYEMVRFNRNYRYDVWRVKRSHGYRAVGQRTTRHGVGEGGGGPSIRIRVGPGLAREAPGLLGRKSAHLLTNERDSKHLNIWVAW